MTSVSVLGSQSENWRSEDALFVARSDDAKLLASLLKAIQFTAEATCYISPHGIKFVTESSKCVQAKVLFQSALFSEFRYPEKGETVAFRIDLGILTDCLNIFGSGAAGGGVTTMKISYDGYGTPLILLLEEDGILTDCSIQTMDVDDALDIDIHATEIPCNIIMKSLWLAQVFADLDPTSETLQIHISPDQPYFRLSTSGETGTAQVECPKDSGVVESFTCRQTQINWYKLKLLKPSERALVQSDKISIRVNKWGTLSIQYLIRTTANETVFIEYLSLPDVLDADDDATNGGDAPGSAAP